MNNLTIKQMRYFEALARHKHFGRAAETCAVSQPALSMQIMDLETELGVELFERAPRALRLTPFGEEFAKRVRMVLRSIDELGEFARSRSDHLEGRLRLGIIPTIAPYLLPTILSRLEHDRLPIDLHIRETLTPKLLEELGNGRIDCAIVALPVTEKAFHAVELFRENFLLVRSRAGSNGDAPDRNTLKDMRLLLLEEGHCFRDQALAFCNIPASAQADGLDGSSLSTLVQMVGAGIGVTLIPEMAVDVETRSAAVSVTRFPEPQPARTIGMIWRRTNPMSEQFQQFANLVRDAARGEKAA